MAPPISLSPLKTVQKVVSKDDEDKARYRDKEEYYKSIQLPWKKSLKSKGGPAYGGCDNNGSSKMEQPDNPVNIGLGQPGNTCTKEISAYPPGNQIKINREERDKIINITSPSSSRPASPVISKAATKINTPNYNSGYDNISVKKDPSLYSKDPRHSRTLSQAPAMKASSSSSNYNVKTVSSTSSGLSSGESDADLYPKKKAKLRPPASGSSNLQSRQRQSERRKKIISVQQDDTMLHSPSPPLQQLKATRHIYLK